MLLAEWIAWMESARRDLYFEPDRRRFWEGLGRSGLEGEESAPRGLVRCLLELLENQWFSLIFGAERGMEGMDGKRRASASI